MYAHEIYAYESHALESHAHKSYPYGIHTDEMHAYDTCPRERHSYKRYASLSFLLGARVARNLFIGYLRTFLDFRNLGFGPFCYSTPPYRFILGDLQTEEKLETTLGNSGLVGEGLSSVQNIEILNKCVVSSGIIAWAVQNHDLLQHPNLRSLLLHHLNSIPSVAARVVQLPPSPGLGHPSSTVQCSSATLWPFSCCL
jgi:hypothetical protein